jgi:hypothetical protein
VSCCCFIILIINVVVVRPLHEVLEKTHYGLGTSVRLSVRKFQLCKFLKVKDDVWCGCCAERD